MSGETKREKLSAWRGAPARALDWKSSVFGWIAQYGHNANLYFSDDFSRFNFTWNKHCGNIQIGHRSTENESSK